NAVHSFENVGSRIYIGGLKRVVSPFDHDDAVLSRGVNKDWGYAAGNSLHLADMRSIDPQLLKVADGCWPKNIVSDPGHHEHICPTEFCGHRLVGALASEPQVELLPEDRFPSFRKSVDERGQVDIGASHNCNARTLRHRAFLNAKRIPGKQSLLMLCKEVNAELSRGVFHHKGHKGSTKLQLFPLCIFVPARLSCLKPSLRKRLVLHRRKLVTFPGPVCRSCVPQSTNPRQMVLLLQWLDAHSFRSTHRPETSEQKAARESRD